MIDLTCPHCKEVNSSVYIVAPTKYYQFGNCTWGTTTCAFCGAQLSEKIENGNFFLEYLAPPLKVKDKLLEILDSEDKWVQQVTCMIDKNDSEELAARIAYEKPLENPAINNNMLDFKKYDPNKVSCWCLSGALAYMASRNGFGIPSSRRREFVKRFIDKYGEIDEFNDSHIYEEVIEAIKSIDI